MKSVLFCLAFWTFFFTKFGQVRPTQVNLFEVKYLKWKDNENKQADQECVCRGLYRH